MIGLLVCENVGARLIRNRYTPVLLFIKPEFSDIKTHLFLLFVSMVKSKNRLVSHGIVFCGEWQPALVAPSQRNACLFNNNVKFP